MKKKLNNLIGRNSNHESVLKFANILLYNIMPDNFKFHYGYGSNKERVHIVKTVKNTNFVYVNLGDGFEWIKENDLIQEELDQYSYKPFDDLIEAYESCIEDIK